MKEYSGDLKAVLYSEQYIPVANEVVDIQGPPDLSNIHAERESAAFFLLVAVIGKRTKSTPLRSGTQWKWQKTFFIFPSPRTCNPILSSGEEEGTGGQTLVETT